MTLIQNGSSHLLSSKRSVLDVINGDIHSDTSSNSSSDSEETRDIRRLNSRLLVTKLSESSLPQSTKNNSSTTDIEHCIKLAIDKGDIATLSQLYKENKINVEQRFTCGWNSLIYASYTCQLKTVKYLIEQNGANINGGINQEFSPLMACCMSTHSRCKSTITSIAQHQYLCCKYLLNHGAQVEPNTASFTTTPLMYASRFGHSHLIQLLIDHGADLNRRDEKGWCPLLMATQHGHLDIVKQLVRNGAETKIKTNQGLTAQDIAKHLQFTNIYTYLTQEEETLDQAVPNETSICSSPSELELFLDIIELDYLKSLFINKYSTLDDLFTVDLDSLIENITDCQKLKLALQKIDLPCQSEKQCEANLELEEINRDIKRIETNVAQIAQLTKNHKTRDMMMHRFFHNHFIQIHSTAVVTVTAFTAIIGCFLFIKRKKMI
ncbi:unnamed protein product [Didymodactylos carnosus]|uniref:Ankyrin repeat, SAM and basic leucine zipper domain-containing protein 1 n=1 Tax=Didymodactylos carnosus TaxID=1234261 RepID=A0A814GWG3_9BILA|nr:unnamed protein product [Didymodactylos carnosus]CAF1454410.1 unnamed protein product [Didymodactylos carnosus]CAF3773415.1 unnamed protein product [Didymodactylos carnosus]CAF4248709.1 unnamed protein product [Didymodactylos carnosus]